MFADIALIEVETDIDAPIAQVAGFNNFNSLNYGGQQATAVGWGWLAENIPPPGVLHEVQMGIDRSCSAQGDICTTGNAMSSPRGWFTCTCYGDSGGPLLFRNIVLGVVSRGPAPCELGDTYYASTEFFGSWVRDTVTRFGAEVNGTVTYPRPLYQASSGEDCMEALQVTYATEQLGVIDAALQATKSSLDQLAVSSDHETQIQIHQVLQELLIDEVVLVENLRDMLESDCPQCSALHAEFDQAVASIVPFMSDIDASWENNPTWAPVNGFVQLLRSASGSIC